MAAKKGSKSAKAGKKASAQTSTALKAIGDKQTKSQILTAIADELDLPKKEVQAVMETLSTLVMRHMKKRGSGEFTIPYTGIRVMRKTRPATPKRMGRNPATGEQIMISAKPARTVVKIRALKALKESVNL